MIPAQAIEAAHKAWREQSALDGSIFEYNLRAAIEAAAPYMLAAAWEEGEQAGGANHAAEEYDLPIIRNPYRK